MEKITKEQFNTAYDKYKPSKFLKFIYTYYNVKIRRPDKPIAWGTLLGVIGWIVGTIGYIIFDLAGMNEIAKEFLWAYVPFAAFFISFPAHFLNIIRIKKIAKKLGISIEQYNKLADRFYGKD